jgi:hypothetical protein
MMDVLVDLSFHAFVFFRALFDLLYFSSELH